MTVHRFSRLNVQRLLIAGLVLAATLLLSLWIGTYTEAASLPPGAVGVVLPMARYTPTWTIPVAIVVGIGGATLAILVLRHRTRR